MNPASVLQRSALFSLILGLASASAARAQEDGLYLPPGALDNTQRFVAADLEGCTDRLSATRLEAYDTALEPGPDGKSPYSQVVRSLQVGTALSETTRGWIKLGRSATNVAIDTAGALPDLTPLGSGLVSATKEAATWAFDAFDASVHKDLIDFVESSVAQLAAEDAKRYDALRAEAELARSEAATARERLDAQRSLIRYSAELLERTQVPLKGLDADSQLVVLRYQQQLIARAILDQRIDFETFRHKTGRDIELLRARSAQQADDIRQLAETNQQLADRLATVESDLGALREDSAALGTKTERLDRSLELLGREVSDDRARLRDLELEAKASREFQRASGLRLSALEAAVAQHETDLAEVQGVVTQQQLELRGLWRKDTLQDGLIYQLYPPALRAELLRQHPTFMSEAFKPGSEERLAEIKRQEAQARARRVVGALEEGRASLRQARQLAINLGLKGQDLERADEALRYIEAAASVAIAYVAPSPQTILAAAVSVTSLFKKREAKRDPQFEELLRQFGLVHERLDHLFEGQQVIIANQQALIENQRALFEALHAGFARVSYEFRDLGEELRAIKVLTMIPKELLLQQMSRNVIWYQNDVLPLWLPGRGLRSVEESRALLRSLGGFGDGPVPEYALRAVHYKELLDRSRLWRAIDEMESYLVISGTQRPDGRLDLKVGDASPTQPVWWIETYTDVEGDARLARFAAKVVQPLVAHALPEPRRLRGERSPSSLFLTLLSPSRSFEESVLKRQWSCDPEAFPEGDYGFQPTDALLERAMSRPLHPAVLREFGETILDMTFYIEATHENADASLVPAADLTRHLGPVPEARRRFRRQRSRRLLRNYLFLLDLGIAQQSLIAGDVALRSLRHDFDRFLRDPAPEPEEVKRWFDLLSEDAVAWRNLFVMMISEHLDSARLSVADLLAVEGEARRGSYPMSWRTRLSHRGELWLLNLGEWNGRACQLPLPPVEELRTRRLVYPAELEGLRRMRRRIARALEGFRLGDEASPEGNARRRALEVHLLTNASRAR